MPEGTHLWLLFVFSFAFIGAVAFFKGILLAYIFTLLSLAVPPGTLFVVDMRLGIYPDHSWSGARRGSCRGRRGLLRRR